MKRRSVIIIAAVLACFVVAALATSSAWDGDITDEAADNLAAGGDSAEDRVLPWNIDGDLLLFFFLAGGATAGFIAGYYWRKLFAEPGRERERPGGEEPA